MKYIYPNFTSYKCIICLVIAFVMSCIWLTISFFTETSNQISMIAGSTLGSLGLVALILVTMFLMQKHYRCIISNISYHFHSTFQENWYIDWMNILKIFFSIFNELLMSRYSLNELLLWPCLQFYFYRFTELEKRTR